MGPEAGESDRRKGFIGRWHKWLREIADGAYRSRYVAHGAELFERARGVTRRDERHGTTPIGDLERFASFDEPQHLAGTLPQDPNSDRLHVLLVAHETGEARFLVPLGVL